MIVLDASVAVGFLLGNPAVERRIVEESLAAPYLIDLEVAQALRRIVAAGTIGEAQGEVALDDWCVFTIERHAHRALLPRVWALRATVSAYDAAYVALAETLDAPLVTLDAKLARSHGHRARIELVR